MISRTGKKGFLAAHYDWIAVGLGVVMLAVGIVFYVSVLGDDPDEAATAAVARIDRMKPAETGVAPLSSPPPPWSASRFSSRSSSTSARRASWRVNAGSCAPAARRFPGTSGRFRSVLTAVRSRKRRRRPSWMPMVTDCRMNGRRSTVSTPTIPLTPTPISTAMNSPISRNMRRRRIRRIRRTIPITLIR